MTVLPTSMDCIVQPPLPARLLISILGDFSINLPHCDRVPVSGFNQDIEAVGDTRGRRDGARRLEDWARGGSRR